MNKELMFSSKTDLWATPQDFFDKLDAEFHFDLDVCATDENAKCKRYFTIEEDGLKQDWSGVCWCNPPYGRGIGDWVEKCYAWSRLECSVVALLPSRTDTKWYHTFIGGLKPCVVHNFDEFIYELSNYDNKYIIWFIKGRLKFGDAKNSAPFPSMIVVWR